MKVEVSNGDIVDKITILQIKLEKIQDSVKRSNVEKELNYLLSETGKDFMDVTAELLEELRGVNLELWDIEDQKRKKEKKKVFDEEFIELARSVYINNDKRAKIKREINILTKSNLMEEKSYEEY